LHSDGDSLETLVKEEVYFDTFGAGELGDVLLIHTVAVHFQNIQNGFETPWLGYVEALGKTSGITPAAFSSSLRSARSVEGSKKY
jgi:hypothetical protein